MAPAFRRRLGAGSVWVPRDARLGNKCGISLSVARSLSATATTSSRMTTAIFSAVAVGITKTKLLSLARSGVALGPGWVSAAGVVTKPAAGAVAVAVGVTTGSRLLMLPGFVTSLTSVGGRLAPAAGRAPTPGSAATAVVAAGVAAVVFAAEVEAAAEGVALFAGVAELEGLAEVVAAGAASTVTAVEAAGTEDREGVALPMAVRATDVPAAVPDGTVI
jgi:hypothetical protein